MQDGSLVPVSLTIQRRDVGGQSFFVALFATRLAAKTRLVVDQDMIIQEVTDQVAVRATPCVPCFD